MICRSDIDEDISDISNEMPAWVELNDFEIGTRFWFDSPYTLLQQAMAQTHWTTLRINILIRSLAISGGHNSEPRRRTGTRIGGNES